VFESCTLYVTMLPPVRTAPEAGDGASFVGSWMSWLAWRRLPEGPAQPVIDRTVIRQADDGKVVAAG
jgi:hypothetical protein